MNRLQWFHTTHGHCDVPLDYEDKELASWVSPSRVPPSGGRPVDSHFVSGSPRPELEATKLKQLRDLDFDWKDPIRSKFGIMVDALRAFYDDRGHLYVSKDDDEQLYCWIKWVRSHHDHQVDGSSPYFKDIGRKRPILPDDELQALNDACFPWKKDDERTFRDDHSLLDFGTIVDRSDVDLSKWVSMTRTLYSHQAMSTDGATAIPGPPRPVLPVEKLEELQQLGFPWADDA